MRVKDYTIEELSRQDSREVYYLYDIGCSPEEQEMQTEYVHPVDPTDNIPY